MWVPGTHMISEIVVIAGIEWSPWVWQLLNVWVPGTHTFRRPGADTGLALARTN